MPEVVYLLLKYGPIIPITQNGVIEFQFQYRPNSNFRENPSKALVVIFTFKIEFRCPWNSNENYQIGKSINQRWKKLKSYYIVQIGA